MARAVARIDPRAAIDLVPMADGGEGTVAALVSAASGTYVEVPRDGSTR